MRNRRVRFRKGIGPDGSNRRPDVLPDLLAFGRTDTDIYSSIVAMDIAVDGGLVELLPDGGGECLMPLFHIGSLLWLLPGRAALHSCVRVCRVGAAREGTGGIPCPLKRP